MWLRLGSGRQCQTAGLECEHVVENSLECCPASAVGVTSVPSKDGMELGMREANPTVLLGAPVLELLWKCRQMRFSY